MSEQLKGVNVDIQAFSKFKSEDCYYIDKTSYIKDILLNSGTTILFTRPRRFGKSITLSMLKSFLEINYENPSDKSKQIELFKDTDVFKDKDFCNKYMGQYPVILLSLKDAWSTESNQTAQSKFFDELGKVAEQFKFLKDSEKLDSYLKKNLQELIDLRDQKVPSEQKWVRGTSFLSDLIKILNKVTSKEVVVLIDEYDVPLSKVSNTDFYLKIKDIIYNLFSSGLKNNILLKKAVITGCLRVAKESIFTGLNNFQSFGLDDSSFSSLFGFTSSEVKNMLSYYSIDDKYSEYKEWYDGYKIGKDDIFCPWDVISRTYYILSKSDDGPQSYWGGTGNIVQLQDMFLKNSKAYAQNFETLLNGGSITITIKKDINYDILKRSLDVNYFWSLMFSSGYLTPKKILKITEDSTEAELVIPNKSVRSALKTAIEWCFTTSNPKFVQSLTELMDILKGSKAIALQKYLKKALASYVSIYDTQKGTDKESMYHAFLNGRLSGFLDANENNYASNAELGDGRADFSFTLDLDRGADCPEVGFIIEIKAAQNEIEMRELAKKAVAQAKEKNYVKGMIDIYGNDIDEVRVFGIAFYKKSCSVDFESIKVDKFDD